MLRAVTVTLVKEMGDNRIGHALVEFFDVLNGEKATYGELESRLTGDNGRSATGAGGDNPGGPWGQPIGASVRARALRRFSPERDSPGRTSEAQLTPSDRLDRIEDAAKARIEKRWKAAGTTLSAGPGLAVEQLADYAIVGAAKINRMCDE